MLALVAVLALRAVGPTAPAALSVTVGTVETRDGKEGWIVPLDVRNDGEAAAKEIVVEASAPSRGDTITVPPATIDYLGGGEEQRVYAVFEEAPDGEVTARVGNYQEP